MDGRLGERQRLSFQAADGSPIHISLAAWTSEELTVTAQRLRQEDLSQGHSATNVFRSHAIGWRTCYKHIMHESFSTRKNRLNNNELVNNQTSQKNSVVKGLVNHQVWLIRPGE